MTANSTAIGRATARATGLLAIVLASLLLGAPARAEFRHGLSAFGDLKYPADFKHFDYINPDAPKGGRLSTIGTEGRTTFDSFNNYILKGDLWEAFDCDVQPVLLIDEIDKADIEFPNDLLRELDRMEFYVYETHETVRAKHRPIIVITSNNEKELPDAFLRRCFFHYIRFPDTATMTQIIDVHFPQLQRELLHEALTTFFKIRDTPGLKKKPTTSELLDWIKLLVSEDIPPEVLRSDDTKKLIPPLYGALLKNEQDVHLFEQLVFLNRRNAR